MKALKIFNYLFDHLASFMGCCCSPAVDTNALVQPHWNLPEVFLFLRTRYYAPRMASRGYGNNDEEKRGWNWLMALKALLPHHFPYSLH
jgi:hypothetical protein